MTANQIRALDDAALYELSMQKGRRGNASTDAGGRSRAMNEYCHGNECVNRVTDWLQRPAKE